jgi:DNA ligase-1
MADFPESTMLLAELVATSDRIAQVSGRLAKIGELASLLRATEGDETEIAVAYLTGNLRQGKIGLGPAAIRGARPAEGAPEPALRLAEVDDAFARIAAARGKGSAAEKVERLEALLSRATAAEQSFLARLVFGEIRQGALEGLMAEAIAQAAGAPVASVRRAIMAHGVLAEVAAAALREGEAGLRRFEFELFRPIRPMLAQPASGAEEALERLGEAALEYKIDGARIQVHKSGADVRVFSRRLNDVTIAVPELVERVRALPSNELILDGEAVAMRAGGAPLPFQVTMRRFGRRLDVEKMRETLPLSPYYFDLLMVDGGYLLDEPYERRVALLDELLAAEERVPRAVVSDAGAAAAFLAQALGRGHEGIMAKSRRAPYEAGSRGFAWLKIKPAHTLDLVVLAAEWGSGRRRGRLSNLHLGARDAAAGGFVMLGKTFKGMTDRMLAWQTEKLLALEIAREDHVVHVRPELVVEVAFSDVQASRQYPGGLALRFARIKRYREDKRAEESDTIEQVREIHRRSLGEPLP